MGGQGIHPQNMPSSQGLRMPGSSSGLGYGNPNTGMVPNTGSANVSNMPSQPMQQPGTIPEGGVGSEP